jgi:CheY-like chemotaxis protein
VAARWSEIGFRMANISAARQHILIVEHDEATIATYARMLQLEGYQVQTVLSAEDGLRAVESGHPDAIIADFHMPGMDGLEFLHRLRERDDTRTTPVAIVTGDYFPDDTVPAQLHELGAVLRFKPLWIEDLITLVHSLLTSATRGGSGGASA